MDGKGRCLDNIFVERLWRSLKCEEVYLNAYADVREAWAGIGRWMRYYDYYERPHRSIDADGRLPHGAPSASPGAEARSRGA